jgi:hypothetical protein
MPDAPHLYDVAISFRYVDLGFATELCDGLSEGLKVFLFTERQEDLAGTDALESFRLVFRSQARLVVILYRAGWGDTPATRVELEAIKDRHYAEGPNFLFVVMMDDSPPPPWLPERLIRFNLKDFPKDQAIGAVKARALEAGSEITKPSTAVLARRAKDRADFAKKRDAYFRGYDGPRLALAEAQRFIRLAKQRVDQAIEAAPGLEMAFGSSEYGCGVRAPGIGLVAGYRNHIVNSLGEALLAVRAFRGPVVLPGRDEYSHYQPVQVSETIYSPEITREHGWCWRTKKGEIVTSESLAERFVEQFFDLMDRQSAGELPPFHS